MGTDSAKKLKSYLGAASWLRLLSLLLLAASVIALIVGISLASKDVDPSTAIEFYPAEKAMKGKYVYLDLTGITDPVASRDQETWYVAVDRELYGYIVKMEDWRFTSLKAHNDWWYAEEEYDIDPTRIYGIPNKIPDELADVVADVFDYDSKEQVRDVFGDFYLDCTDSPNDTPSGITIFLALVLFTVALVLFALNATRNGTARRCLKRLDKLGLTDAAAEQLDSPLNEIIGNDVTRISPDFVYCRRQGSVVALSDILWLYGHVQRYNGVIVSQTLRAATKANKEISVCQTEKGLGTEAFSRIMEVISTRFPSIMLGYSLENLNAYGNMIKEEKAKAKEEKEN